MAGQLIVQLDGETVNVVTLRAPALSVGRTPDNDLTLPSNQVSRRHAEIRIEKEGPVLIDVGSKLGTFINGRQLQAQQPHPLASGDTIKIGPYLITYQAAAQDSFTEPGVEPIISYQTGVTLSTGMRLRDPHKPGIVSHPFRWPAKGAYLQYLPVIFHDNDFLNSLLQVFESIWEPMEQRQDHIELYFDPDTCPKSFLPWIARWLGLNVHVDWPETRLRGRVQTKQTISFDNVATDWPETRLRRLLKEATDLYRWRGTAYGLARMIEVCAGVKVEISEAPSQPFVFQIRLKLTPDQGIDKDFIEDLIRKHKPAHAAYVLEVET